MASSGVDDEDLIDLEDGVGACVSRTTLPEASAEELEHLLDVCPPKLEQKLSLTREQVSVREHSDNGDVLVTLGHDKVVPIRKRIDVVSSETIKRIRDITKNLEPVMRTCSNSRLETEGTNDYTEDIVDGSQDDAGSRTFHDRPDVTYETQAINNAFNFLSEIDDIDDDDPPPDKRRKTDGAGEDSEYGASSSCYPLEPTCLIENSSSRYRDVERSNIDLEANDRTSVIDPRRSNELLAMNHDNQGFEVSPLSKKSQNYSEIGETDFSTILPFENRQPRFARLWDDCEAIPRVSSGRRVDDRLERKSWSEGGDRGVVDHFRGGHFFARSTSVEVNCLDEPSTSNGITRFLRKTSRSITR